MNSLNKCPRCNSSWLDKTTVKECNNCNITYYPLSNIITRTLHTIPLQQVYKQIVWIINSNECRFKDYSGNKVKAVTLPWLSYDITLDKINLYLKFV